MGEFQSQLQPEWNEMWNKKNDTDMAKLTQKKNHLTIPSTNERTEVNPPPAVIKIEDVQREWIITTVFRCLTNQSSQFQLELAAID